MQQSNSLKLEKDILERPQQTSADFHLAEQRNETDRLNISRRILQQLEEEGYQPVFTIQRQHLIGQTHLRPRTTWLPDHIIAGTIGKEPYNPEGDRILCIYEGDFSKIDLQPRITGQDRLFHGVVATIRSIPLADCRLIDSKTGRRTNLIELNTKAIKSQINHQLRISDVQSINL